MQTHTSNGELGRYWSGRHIKGSQETYIRAANISSLTLSYPVWQSVCVRVCVCVRARVHKHVCCWDLQVITVTSNLALGSAVISYRRMARNHSAPPDSLTPPDPLHLCMCECMLAWWKESQEHCRGRQRRKQIHVRLTERGWWSGMQTDLLNNFVFIFLPHMELFLFITVVEIGW